MSSPQQYRPNPVELSADEWQAQVDEAFDIQERIKDGMQAGREALWATAEALYEFDQRAGWTRLGYEQKSDWLADPEINLTDRTYRRLVHAWRELAVVRDIDRPTLAGLDASKVDIVLPAVVSAKATVEDAVADVRVLGARDLRAKYVTPTAPPSTPPKPTDGTEGQVDEGLSPFTAADVGNLPTTLDPSSDQVSDDEPEPEDDDVVEVEILAVAGDEALAEAARRVVEIHSGLAQKRIPTVLNNAIAALAELL